MVTTHVLRHDHRARPGPRRRGARGGARPRRSTCGCVDGDTLGIALDETTTADTVAAVWDAFGVPGDRRPSTRSTPTWPTAIPAGLARTSEFLTHPVFHQHHSETEMLRYLRRLADRDLALDRTMIPLGSCTMKLNATDRDDAGDVARVRDACTRTRRSTRPQGYLSLFADLERWLAEITGYDAVSLQPNAGSQGEFAGLLAIRAYHEDRGDTRPRRVPHPRERARHERGQRGDGRHARRGREVRRRRQRRSRRPQDEGREARRPRSSALMVTYPSTHGVYERRHPRGVRRGARARRAGVPRRREPQRARRPRASRVARRRRVAPEPAQDVLHPARWRGTGRRPDRRCASTWRRTCPTTRSSPTPGRRPASARSRARRGARPGSCRSRGPTSA